MADKVIVTLSLDRQADRDLIRWLDAQPNRSAAIRGALREYLSRSVTVADVYQAVKDLERKLQAGVLVRGEQAPPDDRDEPPDAAAALDALANLGML